MMAATPYPYNDSTRVTYWDDSATSNWYYGTTGETYVAPRKPRGPGNWLTRPRKEIEFDVDEYRLEIKHDHRRFAAMCCGGVRRIERWKRK